MPLSLDEITALGRQPDAFATLVPGDARIRRVVRKEVSITVVKTLLELESLWTARPWYIRLYDIILLRQDRVRREMLNMLIEQITKENS